MPSKRRPLQRDRKVQLTPEIIAAWQSCDDKALSCALGLNRFCELSPLPSEIISRGVSPNRPPSPNSDRPMDKSYDKALAIQRELLAVAGWPQCREAYERNLAEAEEWRDYYAMLIRDPDARYQGTGMDTASLRQGLKEAEAEVRYRKKLLAELGVKERVDG
jgi:hypothetical protein